MTKALKLLLGAVLAAALTPATAQATSVGFGGLPKTAGGTDVAAQMVNIDYAGGVLTVTGHDYQINGASLANNGDFSMTVYLTSTGTIDTTKLAFDSLTVKGGSDSGHLLFLSSDLQAFGYDDSTGVPFHLLWGAGASGTSEFGTTGPIGVNISAPFGVGFQDFAHDFSGRLANADTYTAVPLPAASLMGLGMLPLFALLRRRVARA